MDKNKWIERFKKTPILKKQAFILEQCKGKKVLDIGCIGQDLSSENENWLHGKLKKTASQLVGVDLNEEGIRKLKEKNYTIYTPDSLADNLSFVPDIILMGDVIEHVDDVVSFLNFYKKFGNSATKMLISTPNPFSIRQSFSILLFSKPSINPEHTIAIDPINMLEIVDRAKLNLTDFYWLDEYTRSPKLYNRIILYPFYTLMTKIRKFFSPNYIVIVTP